MYPTSMGRIKRMCVREYDYLWPPRQRPITELHTSDSLTQLTDQPAHRLPAK